MQMPGRNSTGDDYRYGFNGMEEDDEIKNVDGSSYDFGARIYDPRVGRFLSKDKFAGIYSYQSPYIFAGNSPIFGIDINGDSLYILAYTTDDEMFYASALTRQADIENSPGFDPARDKVVLIGVTDLGNIESQVESSVANNSGQYGETVEFGFWSHATGIDGPAGTTLTSGEDRADIQQLMDEGWGKIDFNWSKSGQNRASFYGCNTAQATGAFAQRISSLSNFKGVFVAGQSKTSYPSVYVDIRKHKGEYGLNDDDDFVTSSAGKTYFVRTYMVSAEQNNSGSDAYKMRIFKDGTFLTEMYQPGKSLVDDSKIRSGAKSIEKSGKNKSSNP